MSKLDYYTPKLIALMKIKGGVLGTKLRPLLDKLSQVCRAVHDPDFCQNRTEWSIQRFAVVWHYFPLLLHMGMFLELRMLLRFNFLVHCV